MFPGSCRVEQLSLCSQQWIVATVEDSILQVGRRWLTLSLRKRIPPSVSSSLSQ
jgi:hypothetical protein